MELKSPQGWERVALEDVDEEVPLFEALLKRFQEEPQGLIEVQGRLVDTVQGYAGGHGSRLMWLESLEPGEKEQRTDADK